MLVGTLLTLLTLAVLQVGVVIYVRNVLHDAAVTGAYYAALSDTTLGEGKSKVLEVLSYTIGDGLVSDVAVAEDASMGYPAVRVTVAATLPLLGFLGPPQAMEVTAHAPVESMDP